MTVQLTTAYPFGPKPTPVADDLNQCRLLDDGNSPTVPLEDNSTRSGESPLVSVYFKNLRGALIEHIESANFVFGCVAWFTDEKIAAALSKKEGVSLIVQKEDFLRPDGPAAGRGWPKKLRAMYATIPSRFDRFALPDVACQLSICSDPTVEAVRCAGVRGGKYAPRMHHKFAVFLRNKRGVPDDDECFDLGVEPYAVWTGSFDWTQNATSSLENAVVIQDRYIARAYLAEWSQMLALSEPLDWNSEYVAPEWRLGT